MMTVLDNGDRDDYVIEICRAKAESHVQTTLFIRVPRTYYHASRSGATCNSRPWSAAVNTFTMHPCGSVFTNQYQIRSDWQMRYETLNEIKQNNRRAAALLYQDLMQGIQGVGGFS